MKSTVSKILAEQLKDVGSATVQEIVTGKFSLKVKEVTKVEDLIDDLDKLKINEKPPFFYNAFGTQRSTLSFIDAARKDKRFSATDRKFTFGKLIKDGNNKFVGIRVIRIK